MAGVLLRPVWPVARREEGASPQWGCDRRATKPQAKLGATQRAAVLFAPGFVAHSLQIHFGICSSLAPRLDRKTLPQNTSHLGDTTLVSRLGLALFTAVGVFSCYRAFSCYRVSRNGNERA